MLDIAHKMNNFFLLNLVLIASFFLILFLQTQHNDFEYQNYDIANERKCSMIWK